MAIRPPLLLPTQRDPDIGRCPLPILSLVMDYFAALAYLQRLVDEWLARRGLAVRDENYVLRMRSLLHRLGDPHLCAPIVHIAGSKGKGSTAAMIAAVLSEAGYRTGLYTSPHLHTVRERLWVNKEIIGQRDFGRLVGELAPHLEAENSEGRYGRVTWFEAVTALAFLYFRERAVQWQVVEVGLGGRLDATNVHDQKAACVLTPISLEHTEVLGDTIPQIALEKAGIIVPGTAVVMGLQRESAAEVFRQVCVERGAVLHEVAKECALAPGPFAAEGQEFRLRTPYGTYRLRIPLLGRHQLENAATAVLTLEVLRTQGVAWNEQALRIGLDKVRWPGRTEVLKRRPLLVVDGAHNSDSARRLRETLRQYLGVSQAILVVGVLEDKDLAAIAEEMAPLAAYVLATRSQSPRARDAGQVATAFSTQGIPTSIEPSVGAAIDAALAIAAPEDTICAFGSLTVAAEAREHVLGLMPEVLQPS